MRESAGNSKEAFEGTLIKQYGMERRTEEDTEFLSKKIICRDFVVFICVWNLERIYISLQSKSDWTEGFDCYDGKFSFEILKKLISRYKTISKL